MLACTALLLNPLGEDQNGHKPLALIVWRVADRLHRHWIG
jgi:hypothetical protein